MRNPERPNPKPEKNDNRAEQERDFSHAREILQRTMDTLSRDYPQINVTRPALERLQAMAFEDISGLSQSERESIIKQLLHLHQLVTGEEYQARLYQTMVGVQEISRALDMLIELFGFKDIFEERARKKEVQDKRDIVTRDFHTSCASIKFHIPEWVPPLHPNMVLNSTPEQKIDFADSLAEAAKNRKPGVDPIYLEMIVQLFDQIDADGQLGFKQRYAFFHNLDAGMRRGKAEMQATAAEVERRQQEAEHLEYQAFVEFLYTDIIATSDIGMRMANEDPDNRQEHDQITDDLGKTLRERLQQYPPAVNMVLKQGQSSTVENAFNALYIQILDRLKKAFPRKPRPKKGWSLPWSKPKPEVPAEAPDQSRLGENTVRAAVVALDAYIQARPGLVLDISSRPIEELARGLMTNSRAVDFCRNLVGPLATPDQLQQGTQRLLLHLLNMRRQAQKSNK
jgi:hypothetical protein